MAGEGRAVRRGEGGEKLPSPTCSSPGGLSVASSRYPCPSGSFGFPSSLNVVRGNLDGKKEDLLSVDALLNQRHGVEPYQVLLVKVKEVGGDAGVGR